MPKKVSNQSYDNLPYQTFDRKLNNNGTNFEHNKLDYSYPKKLSKRELSIEKPNSLVKREKSKGRSLKNFEPTQGWSAIQKFNKVLNDMRKEYEFRYSIFCLKLSQFIYN